jgi:hydroxyethylthiazole kinase-like sugar kinase family protein
MTDVPSIDAVFSALEELRPLVHNITNYVAMSVSAYRTQAAAELAALAPTVIRGNASEILSLSGQVRAAGKGVDSSARAEDATVAAASLAQRMGCIVAVTGATDYVSDGASCVAIHSGHALMPRSTALGYSLSAVTAAFTAVHPPRLAANRCARRVRCRWRRGRAALPGARPSAGGNLRRALSDGPGDARPPRPALRVNWRARTLSV